MKITNVETIILRQPVIEMIGDGSQDTVVVLVHTDEGITGIGEVDSSPYIVRQIIEAPASHMICIGLKDLLIGEDPMDVERLWLKMYHQSLYYGRRSATIHAISGIDIALWDIIGKKLGQPISKLLGGTFRHEIPAYCSVLMPDNEDGIKRLVDYHMPKGYTGMKLGWGGLGESYEKDVMLVSSARRALGDDKYMMIDIGKRWDNDIKTAVKSCKKFQEYDPYWVEEPFGPDFIEGYKELRSRVDVHISGGEELGTVYEFRELIFNRCVDIVQPDLSRCGGLTIARKIKDMVEMEGVSIVPHAFKTGILMSATLQFIASLPKAKFLEYCEQDTVLSKNLIQNHFAPDANGIVKIPEKPGLGIELDMDIVNRYRV
jgi:L-rhamnonate dehydratase